MQVRTFIIASALIASTRVAVAQQMQAEGHANYSRTTQTHQNSWGVGGQVQATWGGSSAPIQLGTSAGVDWMKQENSGPTTWTVGTDITVQPGGSSALTPYAGFNVSANWLSGDNSPSGALLGLQYIIGLQLKPEAQGPLAFKVEVRPGYVRTQEHSVMGRFAVAFSM